MAVMMRVAVLVRVGKFLGGRHATVKSFTADVLELDSAVADLEVLAKNRIEIAEDAGALRRWNVSDGDVASEGARIGTEAPDVKIVDVDDAVDCFHVRANVRERDTARSSFQKNVERLANDADAG